MSPKKQPLRLLHMSAMTIAGSVADTVYKFETLTKRINVLSPIDFEKIFVDLHQKIMNVPEFFADLITVFALMEVNVLMRQCGCLTRGATSHRLCLYKMENLIKSCIHTKVTNLDFNHWPSYMWVPLCNNLHRMTMLKDLCLPSYMPLFKEEFDQICFALEARIHFLCELKSFSYPLLCTDKFVKRLSRFCPKVIYLNISSSQRVTDKSITHILSMNNLKHLYIVNTRITDEGLLRLFSGVQELRTLRHHCGFGTALRRTVTKSLPHLQTILICYSTPLSLVVSKCQNLREVVLQDISEDLSILGQLTQLQCLTLWLVDVEHSNLEGLLAFKGRDLMSLELIQCVNVDMMPIMMRCAILKRLSLILCFAKNWAPVDCLTRSLPHFQSLEILEVKARQFTKTNLWWIMEKYRNIEVIDVAHVTEVNYEAVMRALYVRGLLQLRELKVFDCGFMDTVTLQTLLEHCKKLEKVAGMRTWAGVGLGDLGFCNILVKHTNLAVDLDWSSCHIMDTTHFPPEI